MDDFDASVIVNSSHPIHVETGVENWRILENGQTRLSTVFDPL